MSLLNKRSLYDRHTRDELGKSVGRPDGQGPRPSNGDYFSDNGVSDSPFNTERGEKMDQMVEMLKKEVVSNNMKLFGRGKYGPAPGGFENSPFQDLDGGFGTANRELGQFGGPYTHPETGGTF